MQKSKSMTPECPQMKLLSWQLGCCTYIAMVGVCFVFECVWMFFLSDAEAVTERIRNFWKGWCSKTSMNGNISMACYESQNPVTKESVVVGQANRRPVVFSSNVYSRQRRKCYRRLFFRLIFRQKICLMIASSSKAGNTLWRVSSRRLTWAGN